MDNMGLIAAERLTRGYLEYDVTELHALLHPTTCVLVNGAGVPICSGHQNITALTRHMIRFFINAKSVLQPYSITCHEDKTKGQLVWGWPHLVVKESFMMVDGQFVTELKRDVVERVTPDVDRAAAMTHKDAFHKYMNKYLESKMASATPRGGKVLSTHREELPVLDLSFCDIRVPIDVVRAIPRGPALRLPSQILVNAVIADAPDPNEEVLKEDDNAPKMVVKAKNRDGDQAAYEFDKHDQRRTNVAKALLDAQTDNKHLAMVTLARKNGNKFMTSAVRLSNNMLEGEVPMLTPILSTLIVDAMFSLTWLDLSCNMITTIPDLSTLPLNILHLHQNKIAWVGEVKKLTNLPLTSVTLYGNPMDNVSSYKAEVLNILCPPAGSPAALVCKCELKKLDHVLVCRGDKRSLSSYRTMAVSGPRGKTSPRKLNLKGLKLNSTGQAAPVKK